MVHVPYYKTNAFLTTLGILLSKQNISQSSRFSSHFNLKYNVLALNAQQGKMFCSTRTVISRGSLSILTPLFSLNGPPLLGVI